MRKNNSNFNLHNNSLKNYGNIYHHLGIGIRQFINLSLSEFNL